MAAVNKVSGNISFGDGFKSFTINNDESRVIRFNPADPDIITRFSKAMKELQEEKDSIPDAQIDAEGNIIDDSPEQVVETLETFNRILREKLNYIFNSDVYDVVFGLQSPLAAAGDGKMIFEVFIEAAFDIVNTETVGHKKKRDKYLDKYETGKQRKNPGK